MWFNITGPLPSPFAHPWNGRTYSQGSLTNWDGLFLSPTPPLLRIRFPHLQGTPSVVGPLVSAIIHPTCIYLCHITTLLLVIVTCPPQYFPCAILLKGEFGRHDWLAIWKFGGQTRNLYFTKPQEPGITCEPQIILWQCWQISGKCMD